MKMTDLELIQVTGGFNLTGTLISSITRAANVILDIGRSLGSSIRRTAGGRLCPL